MREEQLWDYLVKKLKPLNDNNKTAREVFNKTSKLFQEIEKAYHKGFYEGGKQ